MKNECTGYDNVQSVLRMYVPFVRMILRRLKNLLLKKLYEKEVMR